MILDMARQRKEFTLGHTTIDYLKNFKNASKVIDEAIELHKNKDKVVINQENHEIKVRLHNG